MTLSTRGLWPFLRGKAGPIYERDVALFDVGRWLYSRGEVCPFYDGVTFLRGEDGPIYKGRGTLSTRET